MTYSVGISERRSGFGLAWSILRAFVIALAFINCAGAAPKFRVLPCFPNNDGKDGKLPTSALVFDEAGNLYGTGEGGRRL
jgi:hypothetical protein